MAVEPDSKRAVVYVDGQNLYHAAKDAFGYTYPNYDVMALAKEVCKKKEWLLSQVRFYTGVPAVEDNAAWSYFWVAKMATMGRQGTVVYSRPLRYRHKRMTLPDGTQHTFLAGEEKGIDVRIAIDVIRMAHHREYDVAVLFGQD